MRQVKDQSQLWSHDPYWGLPKLGLERTVVVMMTIEFNLATALRQMLDTSGVQQEQLALDVDISKGSVTNYVKGRTVPKWSVVQRWAEVCDFDPEDQTLRHLWEEARRSGWIYGADPPQPAMFERDERGRWLPLAS